MKESLVRPLRRRRWDLLRKLGAVCIPILGLLAGLTLRSARSDVGPARAGTPASIVARADRLPSEAQLKAVLSHPQLEVVYDAAGKPTFKICRCAIPLGFRDIPRHLLWALIDTEDKRFYDWSHSFGFDPIGLFAAAAAHVSGSRRGGSSLGQQIAKNLVLGNKYTLRRKMQELVLAVRIAEVLSKDEIIATYLNTVDFGAKDGQIIVGVEQAARAYFGKSARDLNLFESATLVGMLKAPTRYNPKTHPDAARRRAALVLSLMLRPGHVSAEQVETALRRGAKPGSLQPVPLETGYYTAWIARTFQPRATAPDFIAQTPHTALRLVVSLDPRLQALAHNTISAMLSHAEASNAEAHQAALIAMDQTGMVRALIGGRDFQSSQFDRATMARRPAGSTFKPFVYLRALEAGRTPFDKVLDEPFTTRESRELKVPKGWPANFDGYEHRPISLEQALALSKNAATVRLAMAVGLADIAQNARRLGMRNARLPERPSLALGACEVVPLELTAAYAAFANGGHRVEPRGVVLALTTEGAIVAEDRMEPGPQVIAPALAVTMAGMLHEVIKSGTGWRANFGAWAAGKTGTTQDNRDAWFVGFTRRDALVTTIWIGNDDDTPMRGVSGSALPAQAWRQFYASLDHDNSTDKSARVAQK